MIGTTGYCLPRGLCGEVLEGALHRAEGADDGETVDVALDVTDLAGSDLRYRC